MSIWVQCELCGTQYQADDRVAGKQVKCRQCGHTFTVPAAAGESAESPFDFEQLARLEQGGQTRGQSHGAGAAAPPPASPAVFTDKLNPMNDANGGGVRSPLHFGFAGARELDPLLPVVGLLGGLIALGVVGFQLHDADEVVPSWLGIVRAVVLVLGFIIALGPIASMGIDAAAKQLRYEIPEPPRRRKFGAYAPAAALALGLWIFGGSGWIPLVAGLVAGVLLSTLTLWIMLRLQPKEVVPTTLYGGVGFMIGGGLFFAIVLVLNLLARSVVESSDSLAVVPHSPVAAHLDWTNATRVAEATKGKPKPSTAGATKSPNNTRPKPPEASGPDTVVAIDPPARAMLTPLIRSTAIATVRDGGSNKTRVEAWDTATWKSLGSTEIVTPANVSNRLVVSPDGKIVAGLTTFPRSAVRFGSLETGRVLVSTDIPEGAAEPQLVGFVSDTLLLMRYEKDAVSQFAWFSAGGEKIELSSNIAIATPARTLRQFAASDDGSLLAIVGTGGSSNPVVDLFVTATKSRAARIAINEFGGTFNSPPLGVAFSPSNAQLAIYYEFAETGEGLIVVYDVKAAMTKATPSADKAPIAELSDVKVASFILPGGRVARRATTDFDSSALAWLRDGRLLLYGRTPVNATTGDVLPMLDDKAVTAVYYDNVTDVLVRTTGTLNQTAQLFVRPVTPPATQPTSGPATRAK